MIQEQNILSSKSWTFHVPTCPVAVAATSNLKDRITAQATCKAVLHSPKPGSIRSQLSFHLCQLGLQSTLLGSPPTSFNQLWKSHVHRSAEGKTQGFKFHLAFASAISRSALQRHNKQPLKTGFRLLSTTNGQLPEPAMVGLRLNA